jgi:hypothetical protein
MEDQLYEEIIEPNGKRRYVRINIQKLLKGGGFNYFYQKNKEYVKKMKEVNVNRQLFEMWHALSPEEQKEWLYKADAFSKLFALTDTTDVYKDIFEPKYPPPTELCKLLTKHESARKYFDQEMTKLKLFYTESTNKELGRPPAPVGPITSYYYQTAEWRNYQELTSVWYKKHIQVQTFTNKVLEAWRSSDDLFVRKSLRDAVCETMKYSTLYDTTEELIWSKTAKEWQASYDAFEHAYNMFCENSKITNLQMRVTNADVKDHLSRMWTGMNRKTQNTWNYSAGDTLPIRHRGVRGLDGDFDDEYLSEDINEVLSEYLSEYPNEDLEYTLPIRHRGVRGLDGDFEQENFDDEDIDED